MNVLKRSRAAMNRSQDNRLQLVFYQHGIGSETDFNDDSTGLFSFNASPRSSLRSKTREARGASMATDLAGIVSRSREDRLQLRESSYCTAALL
ncbi:hypothetical protein BDW22DRAFT_1363583 [Trametopsis cervina]|nr:hypothetical protein BDW22DRAFT_1363583 [Trametopsis cervina]